MKIQPSQVKASAARFIANPRLLDAAIRVGQMRPSEMSPAVLCNYAQGLLRIWVAADNHYQFQARAAYLAARLWRAHENMTAHAKQIRCDHCNAVLRSWPAVCDYGTFCRGCYDERFDGCGRKSL